MDRRTHRTEHGFRSGPILVEAAYTEAKGAHVIFVTTDKEKLEIRSTKTGKVQIWSNKGRYVLEETQT